MLIGMPRVEKVTVSLPKALLDYVEHRRSLTGANRSETVAEMLWEVRRQTELRDREAQYRAAYAAQPETEEENAFTSAAADELLANAGDEWADAANSPTAPDHVDSPSTVNIASASEAALIAAASKGTGRVTAKDRMPNRGATLPAVRKVTSTRGDDGHIEAKATGTKRATAARPAGKAAKRASE
jgi:Arc/MetJ-type ribon-helix-helix transcriptional regulator